MYQYDEYDRALVLERVAQFRDQIARRLSGELSEEEFLPLRLQNGLYLQKHAYMLRVAIPYGTLSADQLRTLAHIARHFDRGYGHFTTRQNIQFNWIELEQVGDILERLAEVEMHAIQTSGNCVRNITTEAFAGVAADELLDPRAAGRDPPPVVDGQPGIPLPAAQVQDRHLLGRAGPRGDHDARHRPVPLPRRSRRAAAAGDGRRRPRAHADPRPAGARGAALAPPAVLRRGHPAGVQPPRPPRQQVQGAHQDPGQGARRRGLRPRGGGGSGSTSRTARPS